MKKFLTVAVLVLMCVSCGTAQAMRPETVDVVKKVLDATDGFDKPIRGYNLRLAGAFLADCITSYNTLYEFLLSHPPKKNENGYIIEFIEPNDRECIYAAANVIIMRVNTLTDYVIAMEAHANKQYDYHKKMVDICSRDWTHAMQLRQNFQDRYGF